ncbi:hypothetical protein PVL29_012120 [Vitis rotundifolia]|uniref:Uncharacterized protein n=1 Tax=Vitis rotundifolia TaxID=103349 RepID=A0AA39DQB2_VITRO|nr:hypothetical protein PVL29_012120 [Vitis rotundifolia]
MEHTKISKLATINPPQATIGECSRTGTEVDVFNKPHILFLLFFTITQKHHHTNSLLTTLKISSTIIHHLPHHNYTQHVVITIPKLEESSSSAVYSCSAMLIRSIANDLLPNKVHEYFSSTLHNLSHYFSSQLTIVIDEFQGLSVNKLFEAADVYLGTRMTLSVRKIRVVKGDEEKKLAVTMDRNEEIVDVFENVRVKWTMVCRQGQALGGGNTQNRGETPRLEIRSYELSFNKNYRDIVLDSYLPNILERSRAIKEENKVVKLHTVNYSNWDLGSILLNHPMTFQTLAMDSELKKELALLLAMSSKSILVIEDIDSLLRPGRMDMHIHMSYCTISAFKQLALNYLGVWHHPLFDQVEGLIGEVKVTPAEVAGELIKSKDPDVSLQGLLGFLHSKNEAKPQKDMEGEDRSD